MPILSGSNFLSVTGLIRSDSWGPRTPAYVSLLLAERFVASPLISDIEMSLPARPATVRCYFAYLWLADSVLEFGGLFSVFILPAVVTQTRQLSRCQKTFGSSRHTFATMSPREALCVCSFPLVFRVMS